MKVLERVVRPQLVEYITSNGVLDDGGRALRSTLSQLLDQNDWVIESLEAGSNVDLLYLDFAKAFDLVDLSIMVTKLNKAGVGGKALGFLKSFLSGRSQKIRVGNSLSEARPVRSGVPQGSVLGPALFLIYIADLRMTRGSLMSKLLKFVDDSKVLTRINREEEVFKLQSDLTSIYK